MFLNFISRKTSPGTLCSLARRTLCSGPLMVRLCAGTDNGHGETGPENPFLTFALVSAFCEQDIFFPFLKTCLKQSMADQVATVINRNVE
ncbi:putative bacterial regulatory helix-turn-helix protein, araC family [Salmonella enterica subsp. enterica]|nr:putative bacterial regulatory helix-turn-helix protein, araC family [Salmonella enterica subsp. enterica]